jgi:2-polyprenyl-6-methoxyphenol hydroxylase-like FAD-dependent oxidoreductase
MAFHVLIIGGGIGGPCLAQGLKKAGVSVAVYERDRTRTERLQGYRIHIDPNGSRALHACLPAELFQTFASTCGKSGKGFKIMTHELQELLIIDAPLSVQDPIAIHRAVSRITLRQVLLAGLDDVVHLDKKFTHYSDAKDGRIIAHFEDGTTAIGDLLVAADGVKSKVRQQFLPDAEPVDTGMIGIAAKVPLTNEFDRFTGANSIMGPRADGMFIARWERKEDVAVSSEGGGIGGNDGASLGHSGLLFDNLQSYIFWAYLTTRENYSTAVHDELPPETLLDIVQRRTSLWHSELRNLVKKSAPDTVAVWKIRTSVPIEHWQTRNLTLLGDAIHSMTPARGIGANIALRDAELLCSKLIAVHRGESPLLQAVQEYELEMLKYAFEAVRASEKALRQFGGRSAIGTRIAKVAMRTINHLPKSIKYRILGA